jgi:hypothetical protein
MGKVYRVYRMDLQTNTKVPIGTVQERRNEARGGTNTAGLTKLARKIFAATPEDQNWIFLGEELIA